MKVAIIGAGFVGLSAAYKLSKNGVDVTVFEKENLPGGLALGFKENNWEWYLEKHYHHFFTNDKEILDLCKEVNHSVITKRPKTSVYTANKIYQLDSPTTTLLFPKLTIFQRIRMGLVLAFLRYSPFLSYFEKITAQNFLSKIMGEKAYKMLWEPLLVGKFGNFAKDISLAWFWARIKKRTTELSYPEGGFLELANKLTKEIKNKKGNIFLNTEVTEIRREKGDIKLCFNDLNYQSEKKFFYFDKAIVTLPSFPFLKIAKDLPKSYQNKLRNLKNLGAINLVLRLKEKFLKDNTYWLNVCDKKSNILAIAEHTNFMDKKFYNNEHIVYIGNYLPIDHPYMKITAGELLKIYDPFLKKINPTYRLSLIAYHLFSDPFAQPIIPTNYSKIMPPFETPVKNLYLANIQQVYPWDRGTNYAVELGGKIAELILK